MLPNKKNEDSLYKIIEEIETYRPGLEIELAFLINNDSLPEYANLLRIFSVELAKGRTIAELPNADLWIKIQRKVINLLLLLIAEGR